MKLSLNLEITWGVVEAAMSSSTEISPQKSMTDALYSRKKSTSCGDGNIGERSSVSVSRAGRAVPSAQYMS